MINKKLLFLICIFLLVTRIGNSQESNYNKVAATLDLGGNSGGYSLSGELKLLSKEKYLMNIRLGFGYSPVKNTQFAAVPFGVNFLTGKGKHHFEGGLGLSYIMGLKFHTIQIGEFQNYYPDKAAYFVPSVGYRFDKLSKGIIFKVYFSPLILVHDFLDEDKFIEDVTQDVIVFGDITKKDWFEYFYGDNSLPKAKSAFGYFGITLGYRF